MEEKVSEYLFYLMMEPTAEKVVVKFEFSNKCLEDYYRIKESKYYDNYSTTMLENYGACLIYYIDQEELDKTTDCQ